MKGLGMYQLTDRFNLGTIVFFVIVKFLEFLQKMGLTPREDGWRRVTQSYLRSEHSKFVLSVFGLDFCSDLRTEKQRTSEEARAHLIERLARFLKQYRAIQYQHRWHKYSAKREKNRFIDITEAEFDEAGNLANLVLYFDLEQGNLETGCLTPDLRSTIVTTVIEAYNQTRGEDDKKRPYVLRSVLKRWCSKQAGSMPGNTKKVAEHFIDRILSSTFIRFESVPDATLAQDNRRFRPPSFIQYKHPGFGVLNIACRFSNELKEADLWVQFSHIPIDGVPAQEILDDLKTQWGVAGALMLPAPDKQINKAPVLCSTRSGANGVYHTYQFVDFRPLLRMREALNRRYVSDPDDTFTVAALLIWELAQYEVFHDVKFAVPVDLPATAQRERTLGFVFIRPHTYVDRDKPDRGFFRFQQEFNRSLHATRRRTSASYRLLESYALMPAWVYAATLKLMAGTLEDFVGTVGLTIIKGADFFVSPYSDVHTDGFIALGDFLLPSADGGKVGVVSIKGPREKVNEYVRVIQDVMKRASRADDINFEHYCPNFGTGPAATSFNETESS